MCLARDRVMSAIRSSKSIIEPSGLGSDGLLHTILKTPDTNSPVKWRGGVKQGLSCQPHRCTCRAAQRKLIGCPTLLIKATTYPMSPTNPVDIVNDLVHLLY